MENTIIYLIRHSEQLREYTNIVVSQEENEKIVLSVEGEKRAERLSLNSELINISEIWSSSYSGTAKYIAYKNNLKINIDNRLNERKLRRFRRIKEVRRNKRAFIYNRTNN